MCAITGVLTKRKPSLETAQFIQDVLVQSRSRGRDAFGVEVLEADGSGPTYSYRKVRPTQQDVSNAASAAVFKLMGLAPRVLLANNRAAPTPECLEDYQESRDVQPYHGEGNVVVHNGTVANDEALRRGHVPREYLTSPIDSSVIPFLRGAWQEIDGSYAICEWDAEQQRLRYGRDFQPLWHYWNREAEVFSSLPPEDVRFAGGFQVREVKPYTIGTVDDRGGHNRINTAQQGKGSAVVFSGGLDSTVAATQACFSPDSGPVRLIHFTYGCRAQERELDAVQKITAYLRENAHEDTTLQVVDVGWLKDLGGSTLTDTTREVAKSIEGAELPKEWVPARNLVFMSIAAAICDRYSLARIYSGVNIEEAGAYADNSEPFFRAVAAALQVGTQSRPALVSPVGRSTKPEIVLRGYQMGAPLHLSWSCYHGGRLHCGDCGPCYMRRRAHEVAGLPDKIAYADTPKEV